MVTIDLNVDRQFEDLFKRVEAGETLRVVRGDREIAVVQPADMIAGDEAYLNYLANLGAQQIATAFPANEFSDWEDGNGPG